MYIMFVKYKRIYIFAVSNIISILYFNDSISLMMKHHKCVQIGKNAIFDSDNL